MTTLRTRFLGLLKRGHGDSLAENDYEFTDANLDKLDAAAQLVTTHRHDGQAIADADAPDAPELEVTSDEDGAFPGDATINYRIAKVSADGIESPASAVATIETPGSISQPTISPELQLAGGGELPAGLYGYAYTQYRGIFTFETLPSPARTANLPVSAGDTQAVALTFPELDPDADGINIYRRIPNSTTWNYLVSVPAANVDDGFIDDGTILPSTERLLPAIDYSADASSITITPPGALAPGEAWRLYRAFGEDTDDLVWADSFLTELSSSAPWEDLGSPTGGGSPALTGLGLTNPNPIDLWTETSGVLPPERLSTAIFFNPEAEERTANVHNDWAELMAALAFMPEAGRLVVIESAFTVPTAGMPTDGWHLHGATFSAPLEDVTAPVILTFPTGTKLDPEGVGYGPFIGGNIGVYSTSNAPIVTFEGARSIFLVLSRGAVTAKSAPFFAIDVMGTFIVAVRDGHNIIRPSTAGIPGGDYEAFQVDACGFGLIISEGGSGIDNDTFRGTANNVAWQRDARMGDSGANGQTQTNFNSGDGWAELQWMTSADGVRLDDPAPGMPGMVGAAIRWLAENGSGSYPKGGGGSLATLRTRTVTANIEEGTGFLTLTGGHRFSPGDKDSILTGDGIPEGTTIGNIDSRTVASMTESATADGTNIEVTIENVTPAVSIEDVENYPAGGYSIAVGTTTTPADEAVTPGDPVEILLPPAADSGPILMLPNAGDGASTFGDMPALTIDSPGSEFTFVVGDLAADPDALVLALLCIPFGAGEVPAAGWAIIVLNPPTAGGGGGDAAQLQSERPTSAGQRYALERVGRTFDPSTNVSYTATSATGWLIASDSDQSIIGFQTFIETAGASGAEARIVLYPLVDGNAQGAKLAEVVIDCTTNGYKTDTFTAVPVTPAGLVAVIAVNDETIVMRTFAEKPGIDLGNHENGTVMRLTTPGADFSYGTFPANGEDLDLRPVTHGHRPYVLWTLA